MALWWCRLFTAGMSLVVATKIAFIGWGIGIRSLDFTGFGGHSMRATVVIPVRFYLILQKAPPIARTSGVSLGIVFGVIIGISRLVVHAHSVSEAVAGCILGGMVSLSFIWILGPSQNFVLYRSLIALSLIALLAVPNIVPNVCARGLDIGFASLDYVQVAILGVIQGITELLPISSTAHMRVVPALLGSAARVSTCCAGVFKRANSRRLFFADITSCFHA